MSIITGSVGVVELVFNGVNPGKTTAGTEITDDKDWLDIIFQQTGTKPDDKTETGKLMMVNATFGEIDNELVEILMNGVTAFNGGTLKFGKNVYTSLKSTKGGKLEIIKVNSEGVQSTDPYDKITFYIAVPENTSAINWDAASQKNWSASFHCFAKQYTNAKSGNVESSFGYMGIASSAGMPTT